MWWLCWWVQCLQTLQESIRNRGITSRGSHTLSSSTVRHVACSLLYCCDWENPREGSIRKQILVSFSSKLSSVSDRCGVFCVFIDGQQNREDLVGLQKPPKRRYLPTPCCQSNGKQNPQSRTTNIKNIYCCKCLSHPRAWKLSTVNCHLELTDHLIPLCRRRMWRRIFFAFCHSRRNRWAEAHLMFNTSDVNVCSCDIWQLEQCRSDRHFLRCVRQ